MRGPRPPGRRPPGKRPSPPRPPGKTPQRPAGRVAPRKKRTPPPRRPSRPKGKAGPPWFKLFLLLVLLVAVGALGYVYYRGSASLPQTDGSVSLAGLGAPVEVLRDSFGVPHLYAASLEDLARATGYVHAQDRFFQMEVSRRLGEGTMAELFGSSFLALDRRGRSLGLAHAARAELERMDPAVRRLLDSYAEGVNAYRQAHRDSLPPEFQILQLEPEPWEPQNTLVVLKWMSYLLSSNGSVEILRAHLSDSLGVEAAYSLTGLPPPLLEEEDRSASTPFPGPAKLASAEAWTRAGGSNAWVVSGARTASGRPLLAADPHLPLLIPSLWYEIHLAGGGLNVVGATFPGIPFVLIGHNEAVAWGAAALYSDVQDIYVETLNPENAGQYAEGEGWADFQVTTETIQVAGAAPVPIEIRRTRHGAVVSDEPRQGRVLALRWDGLWSGDNILAFLRLNRATNWTEFQEALRSLAGLPQAFVYADVEGNIGFFPSGDIPIRVGFDGTMPLDGASGVFEWQGFIPHEMKPVLLNPEEGIIIAANQKMVPDDAVYPLGRDQLAPFRADRIRALLSTAGPLRPANLAHIQADRYDGSTEPILRTLMALQAGPDAREVAQDLMRGWDGQMSRGAPAALYNALYLRLVENTFKDEMGDDLFSEFVEFLELGYFGGIHSIIDDGESPWWDDTTTPAVEDRQAIFNRSLGEAVTLLEESQGGGPGNWDWETLHGVTFEHPLGRERPLNWIFNRGPIPFGGSAFTVANAMVSLSEPFRCPAGTSFRLIVDVGDWANTTSSVPTGASGHPLSPHYFDQNRNWRSGVNHPLLFERSRIEGALEGRLTLTP